MRNIALIASSLLLAACGTGGLSAEEVQSIPDGTAVGSSLSGRYALDVRVVECRGRCGPFTVGIFSSSLCDVGDVDTLDAEVTQADGHLRIETDDLPSLFEGGAYADDSFEVGGYATQLGGALEITARSVGSFEGGQLRATIDSRSWGTIEGQGADCHGVREVTGVRED